jgi:diguanylate cyclase (GGDEF)-like protein
MKTELSRAQRYDLNFALIIIDIDNFKDINDTFGHPAGDEILKKVSLHIKNALRESDIVSRYGGDEFVALLPETTKEDTKIVGERIRQSIVEKKLGGNIPIHISVGIAAYPDDGVFSQDIINKADGALYKAKQEGRNRVCVA